MTEVNPLDPIYGLFVNGLDVDGNLLTSRVDFSTLTFQGLFGQPGYSSSTLNLDVEEKTLTMDYDNPYLVVGVTVQCIAIEDPECWFYGILVSRTNGPDTITVVPTQLSALRGTFTGWSVQVTAANTPGVDTCVSTSAVDPTTDGPFTMTVPEGKFFPVDGSVLMRSLENAAIYVYCRVVQYTTTSLILAKVTTNATVPFSYTAWTISTIDGSPINEHLLAISFDTHTLGTGDKVFTIDTGKFFPVGSSVSIASIAQPENHMSGIVTSYVGTLLSVFVTSYIGSGSFSSWSLVNSGSGAQQSAASSVTGFALDVLGFGLSSNVFLGATVTLNTNLNKLFSPGSHIIVSASEDATQYFRGLGLTYDAATGLLTIFVTDISPTAFGFYSTWTIVCQDGPGEDTSTFALSTTSQTIGYQSYIFETQANKFFATNASVLIQDLSSPTNYMYGIVISYSGTALQVDVSTIFGTGTSSLWSIRQLDGPPGLRVYIPEDWGSITETAYQALPGSLDYGPILQTASSSEDYGSVAVIATLFSDYGFV